jgi:arylsulfatase A-like enzyme|tara:strand:- start:271 stop:1638 length:1368 start_codon:yes stop_codon:yes gene_type:complete
MLKQGTHIFLSAIYCASAAPPNIVLIYADDLGYTDLSCQGSEFYETPNIDRIAKEGMTFTNAYAGAANCAPSRACLMTGHYPPRHGVFTVGNSDRGKAKNRKLIPIKNTEILDEKFVTLGEALQAKGYRTCVAGKWHLSKDPTKDGFHTNFGGTTWGHPKSYFSPYKNPYLKDGPKGEHLPERLGRDVANWIAENAKSPFFVYLPFYSVHTPIQAPKDLTAKYEKKPAHGSHRNPKYGAMLDAMDQAVGHILKTLDDNNLAQNTLVIFTSDNGPHGSVSRAEPLRGVKGMYYEGGIREPFLVRYPGVVKAGSTNVTPIIQIDLYPTFLELAGESIPKRLDGVSLTSAFKSKPLADRSLFWHFPAYLQSYKADPDSASKFFRTTPCSVIRKGDWKLIQYFEDGNLELYNLKNDLSEKENLAGKETEKTAELLKELKSWQMETKAPIPTVKNPKYEE